VSDGSDTSERLVKLETKLETIESFLNRLEKKLDMREEKYVTRDVLNEILRSHDDKSHSLQKAINDLRDWINALVALTALVIALFIKH
jgi:bacterioferritin (cytochrome b1)